MGYACKNITLYRMLIWFQFIWLIPPALPNRRTNQREIQTSMDTNGKIYAFWARKAGNILHTDTRLSVHTWLIFHIACGLSSASLKLLRKWNATSRLMVVLVKDIAWCIYIPRSQAFRYPIKCGLYFTYLLKWFAVKHRWICRCSKFA